MKKVSWISKLVLTLLVFPILFFSVSIGTANAWEPTKPIEFIIPAGAGGGADVMARFIAPIISKYNLAPKPVIVINKSGGAGAEGFLYLTDGESQMLDFQKAAVEQVELRQRLRTFGGKPVQEVLDQIADWEKIIK